MASLLRGGLGGELRLELPDSFRILIESGLRQLACVDELERRLAERLVGLVKLEAEPKLFKLLLGLAGSLAGNLFSAIEETHLSIFPGTTLTANGRSPRQPATGLLLRAQAAGSHQSGRFNLRQVEIPWQRSRARLDRTLVHGNG